MRGSGSAGGRLADGPFGGWSEFGLLGEAHKLQLVVKYSVYTLTYGVGRGKRRGAGEKVSQISGLRQLVVKGLFRNEC